MLMIEMAAGDGGGLQLATTVSHDTVCDTVACVTRLVHGHLVTTNTATMRNTQVTLNAPTIRNRHK